LNYLKHEHSDFSKRLRTTCVSSAWSLVFSFPPQRPLAFDLKDIIKIPSVFVIVDSLSLI